MTQNEFNDWLDTASTEAIVLRAIAKLLSKQDVADGESGAMADELQKRAKTNALPPGRHRVCR